MAGDGARPDRHRRRSARAQEDVETKKNLLVRLQAPRFFVERDQVVLTANVHNYLKTDKRVKVSLQTGDGVKLSDRNLPRPIRRARV
jgi:uncharacterized protein YfaS (alpha-2-macroglobulin family)